MARLKAASLAALVSLIASTVHTLRGLSIESHRFLATHEEMTGQAGLTLDCRIATSKIARAAAEFPMSPLLQPPPTASHLVQTLWHLKEVGELKSYVARSASAFFTTGGEGKFPFSNMRHFVAAVEPLVMLGRVR